MRKSILVAAATAALLLIATPAQRAAAMPIATPAQLGAAPDTGLVQQAAVRCGHRGCGRVWHRHYWGGARRYWGWPAPVFWPGPWIHSWFRPWGWHWGWGWRHHHHHWRHW